MIRSSQHTLKFCNASKLEALKRLEVLYKDLLQKYVDMIIKGELPLKKFFTSKALPKLNEIEHSAWRQACYKQAAQTVRGELVKVKKRVFTKYKKLYAQCIVKNKHRWFTSKRFSELKINYMKRIKIDVKNVVIDIDARVFDVEVDKTKEFDEFIKITLPWFKPNKRFKRLAETINIPIKYHKHSNKFNGWNRRNIVKYIAKNHSISLVWEKKAKEKPEQIFRPIGIDLGFKKLISDSNGEFYGREELQRVYHKISKKKRGSKAYKRALIERTNLTNKFVNEFLYKNDFDCLVIEDLKSVKANKSFKRLSKSKQKKTNSVKQKTINNLLQYWSYRTVIDKLERMSEEEGFHLIKVQPAYTSQTCSECGAHDESYRKGEDFECGKCRMKMDADTNAARNILALGVFSLQSTQNEKHSPNHDTFLVTK